MTCCCSPEFFIAKTFSDLFTLTISLKGTFKKKKRAGAASNLFVASRTHSLTISNCSSHQSSLLARKRRIFGLQKLWVARSARVCLRNRFACTVDGLQSFEINFLPYKIHFFPSKMHFLPYKIHFFPYKIKVDSIWIRKVQANLFKRHTLVRPRRSFTLHTAQMAPIQFQFDWNPI